MAETTIEWTSGPNGEEGYTFNPWLGCSKVHTGCTNCYAEVSQAVSMRKGGGIRWGEVWQGGQRVVVADSTWKHPLTWARKAVAAGERRKVFCASLSDVLEVPEMPPFQHLTTERRERVHAARKALDAARSRIWDTIRKTAHIRAPPDEDPREVGYPSGPPPEAPGLDWLLLTKRPENWRLVPEDVRPLVWLGTSISDQKTADEMDPRLLEADGFRYRFLSVEPLLEDLGEIDLTGIHWVIVGGESGRGARACELSWVRNVVRQCRRAGIPCFVKQLGAIARGETQADHRFPFNHGRFYGDNLRLTLKHPKGGDIEEWPEDLRVQMFPGQSWEHRP